MVARLGRYTVLKHLASGGMADVLLGRADGIEGFERHVVLKRIKPQHARDERFIRMFLDEARVAASLHHHHIVQVHDIGQSDGEYFIAMEYIHGEDVRTLLSNASRTRAHVPLGYAVAIVAAAAAGLHYAHERRGIDRRPIGIVHRDVSPSNILVGYDGSIKIVDFGIAKASRHHDTRSGSLKGKVSYMSPEQCRGTDVDRRSDVYSLGVVLYELATTTRLFKGENDYLVMDQIVNGRVSLPQVRRPDLPNELSAIIMRAITPEPERRYATAEELRGALDQFAARARLTASSGAIGAYLRKQFGEKPEPWISLEGPGIASFDDVQLSTVGTAPSNSWRERPPGAERRSSATLPRLTGSSPVLAGTAAPDPQPRASASPRPADLERRSREDQDDRGEREALEPAKPPPTDSKMGWESQPRAQRNLTPTKVAAISAPLVLLLGVAIWQLAGSSPTEPSPPPAALVAQPAPPPPAPPVTPAPQEPPPTTVVVQDSLSVPSTPAPAPTRPRDNAPRRSPAKVVEGSAARTPPPASRAEFPAPAAPSTATEPSTPGVPTPTPAFSATSSPGASPGSPPGSPSISPSGSSLGSSPAAVAAYSPTVAPPTPAPSSPTSPTSPPAEPPSPAPPSSSVATAAPPTMITPAALDANRIAGEKEIVPDDTTQAEIGRAGVDKLVGSFKLCIAVDGNVSAVSQLRSTGFPAYDAKIDRTIRGKWRYRPFLIDGKPAPVCTAIRFVYSQK